MVNRDFRDAIHRNGGSQQVYPQAVIAETEELFDCTVNQLYRATGGKKGDRSTLPEAAQKAYMASEIRATHELQDATMDCETQAAVDGRIVGVTRNAAKETRRWLPW